MEECNGRQGGKRKGSRSLHGADFKVRSSLSNLVIYKGLRAPSKLLRQRGVPLAAVSIGPRMPGFSIFRARGPS